MSDKGVRVFFVIALLALLTPNLSRAESQDSNGATFAVDSYYDYMPSRKAEAMPGKIEVQEANNEFSCEFKAFDKLPVALSFSQEYIGLENSTPVELPAHLVGLSFGVETTLPFFNIDKTYLRLAAYPSVYGDDWSYHSSSFRLPSHTYLIYQPNDKLILIGGVAVYPDFESEVFPIFGLIYKPDDKWVFNLTPKNPSISYKLNNRLTLFGEGGYSFEEFEVAKDFRENVVLQYKEANLGLGIGYKLNKYINCSISAGGIFSRYLKYRDSLGKVNIKNGMYTEFGLEIEI